MTFDFSSPFSPIYRISDHCPAETNLNSSLKATGEVAAWNSYCCKKSVFLTQCFEVFVTSNGGSQQLQPLGKPYRFSQLKKCIFHIRPHSLTFDLLMQLESNSSRKKESIQAGEEQGETCSWVEEGWLKAQIIGRDSVAQTRKQKLK